MAINYISVSSLSFFIPFFLFIFIISVFFSFSLSFRLVVCCLCCALNVVQPHAFPVARHSVKKCSLSWYRNEMNTHTELSNKFYNGHRLKREEETHTQTTTTNSNKRQESGASGAQDQRWTWLLDCSCMPSTTAYKIA